MPVRRLVPPSDWPTLGWGVLEWIEHYLCHGPGDVQGEPIVFDDEFAQIILDAYRIYPKGHERAGRRCVSYFGVSMPKGRAKSEFAGALVCAELLGPVRFDGWNAVGEPVGKPITYPFIRPLATEEGQTGNTYGNVVVMLEHAVEKFGREWRFDELDIGATRIHLGKGGRLGGVFPSTAGAASKDGGKESFSVADEPHLYVLPELRQMHAMVRRNTRKRREAQPWMLATTTMFEPGQASVAEELYDEAERLMAGDRQHFGFAWHHREGTITAAEWDDDAAQLASLVEAYGPAAEWMDLESMLLDEIRAPGAKQAESARYFHNVRWKGENKAIDLAKWDALADPRRTPTGGRIVVGFDGSDRGAHADDTVLVGVTVEDVPHVFLIGRWRRPAQAGEGWRVPRPPIRQTVLDLRDDFTVARLGCDPPFWREEIDTWAAEFGERDGEAVVLEVPTNQPSRFGPAIDRFLEAVDQGLITHDGSEELREAVGNALLGKTGGRAEYPVLTKPTVDLKIDALVAAVIAYSLLDALPEESEATFVSLDEV